MPRNQPSQRQLTSTSSEASAPPARSPTGVFRGLPGRGLLRLTPAARNADDPGNRPAPSPRGTGLLTLVSRWSGLLLVAVALGMWLAAAVRGGNSGRVFAHAFSAGLLGLALLLLHASDRQITGYGLFRPIIGADGRFSTSLTQLGLWTIAVGTALAYLLGRVLVEDQALADVLPEDTWDQYLILLGGPFAAAVLAKGIVTYKLDRGTLQKSEADAPVVAQVGTTDDGSPDLVDSQYLLFNVIALGYFAVEMVRRGVLPTMPGPLLAMTGATAALYVGTKAAQRNAPSITSVSPPTAAPGDEVTVLGINFDPAEAGDEDRRVSVALSGYAATIWSSDTSDTRIRFLVPAGAEPGPQEVAVTSSAGAQTPPHPVEIRSADIVITGLADDQPLRPGRSATVLVHRLGTEGQPLLVLVGVQPVTATPTQDRTRITFSVPDPLPPGDAVAVTVKSGTGVATQDLPVEQPRVRSAWRLHDGAIAVAATGWHSGNPANDPPPQILVDGRPAAVRPGFRDNAAAPLVADPPPGTNPGTEARLAVIDDLGRRSQDHLLAAQPA